MTSDRLTPAQKVNGGFGADFFTGRSWGFGQPVLDTGAYGWDGGFGTSWLVDPTCDLVVTRAHAAHVRDERSPQGPL